MPEPYSKSTPGFTSQAVRRSSPPIATARLARVALRGTKLWTFRAITLLGPSLLLIAILELGARVVDARTGFHGRLMNAYAMMERNSDPRWLPALGWEHGEVGVRSAKERRIASYEIGGHVIAEPGVVPELAMIDREHFAPDDKLVFVVGGSAAFGYPYAFGAYFATRLDRMLRPEGYRVLNAARVGASSGTVRDIAERILDVFDVHTLIVFAGNNEWIRWQPGEAESLGVTRSLARSRAVALLLAWGLERRRAEAEARIERARTEDVDPGVFVEHFELTGSDYALRFARDDATSEAEWLDVQEAYLDVFEENLRAIIDRAALEPARVLLLSVPYNHRLSPAWKHPQPLAFDEASEPLARDALARSVAASTRPERQAALDATAAALAPEPRSAILHHLRGEQLEALGRYLEAEEAYSQAREHMIGNLGSRLSINGVIAEVARDTGVALVDLPSLFDENQHRRGRYFNEDLIHDDCHPTPAGHRLIAEALRGQF
jgi:tetratricopeptide (TPR) repeat protein